jgi:hypothetical protein
MLLDPFFISTLIRSGELSPCGWWRSLTPPGESLLVLTHGGWGNTTPTLSWPRYLVQAAAANPLPRNHSSGSTRIISAWVSILEWYREDTFHGFAQAGRMHALIFFYFFAVLMFVVCHQSSRSRNYWPWFLIFPCILSDLFLVCNQTLFRKYRRMNTKIYCTKVYDLGQPVQLWTVHPAVKTNIGFKSHRQSAYLP